MHYRGPLIFCFSVLFYFAFLQADLYAQQVETIKIGDQVWMKHNLNRDVLGSICYDKDSLNCVRYGRLYFWQSALDACPDGFRLPTDEDWSILTDYLGGEDIAGKKLKKNGDSGFSALLAGNYHPEVKLFSYKGEKGYYWTATSHGYSTAWIRSVHLGEDKITRTSIGKSFYFSIRCIKAD
jgi:uncharacterized protein (TIGR02145 family)